MMVETSDGTRVELFTAGSPGSGGTGMYDSRDGSICATFTYSSVQTEIGQPLRYVHQGQLYTLDHGEIINTLIWRQAA